MKIIIVGGGTTGLTLANLLGDEYDIRILEKEESLAEVIATKTNALVIVGDGGDISALKDAGLAEADAIVTTVDDKTNLVVCQIAKSENLKKIISLVNEPQNEELFVKLGISHLVSAVGTNVIGIKRLLYQVGDARIIAQIGQGELQIVELPVSEGSQMVGKSASLKKASIAAIYRSGEIIIPKRTTIIEKGDLLVMLVKTKDLPKITELIMGQ